MNAKSRGVIVGMSGFFAGALASQLRPWSVGQKALLAAAVTVFVSLLLLVGLPHPQSNHR
jgi:uncharacterized membrane protein YoaK (UPF0700 family)